MIIEKFLQFKDKFGNEAFSRLNEFFDIEKGNFYNKKIPHWIKQGYTNDEAVIKARQGWVSTIGRNLEKVIEILIQDFCNENNLKVTNDKILKRQNLSTELDLVKRLILVDFGEYALLPDGDIIIYKLIKDQPRIIAILSVKNSFRERYTETPYWKIKLSQSQVTNHIKVFMITPDKDDEISNGQNPRKSRIVMEYELDGIYLAKDDFDTSQKIKSINFLINDLRDLI
jgi:type II restriction enzyme